MINNQKQDQTNLSGIIYEIRKGYFVIPNFQREFEWDPSHVRELIRSIFLDYYIGSLLLWKCEDNIFEALACEAIYGFEEKGEPLKIVLDGQQRLTAMYLAFMGPNILHPKRANRYLYFIHIDQFMNEDYDDAFFYEFGKKGEKLLENRTNQFKQNIFPLAVMGDPSNKYSWLRGYENYWKEQVNTANSEGQDRWITVAKKNAENAIYFREYLDKLGTQYSVSFIELDKDIDIEKVCDIFTRINSRGMKLDIFDLMNAMLTPQGIELKQMYKEAKQKISFFGTDRMNVYLLHVMSILRQNYCTPKYLYYLVPGKERKTRNQIEYLSTEKFKQSWIEAVNSMETVIKLLKNSQEYGAISSKYIPYASILPPFAALNAWTKQISFDKQRDADHKIRSWYWISVFLKRYSGSVLVVTSKDFIEVKKWIESDTKPSFFAEAQEHIPNINLYEETRRGTSIYNGVFNLLILEKATDWYTAKAPKYDDIDDHHIVPRSWGTKQNFRKDISIDTILNRTLLTSTSNREVIGNKLPNEYLPNLVKKYGKDTVKDFLISHFISEKAFNILMRKPFKVKDYEEFIEERLETIRRAIINATRINHFE